MVYVLSVLIGFLTAFVGSIAGLGGGIILVPSLLLLSQLLDSFSWAAPQNIVGISLLVMVFTGLSSSIAYMKKGRVDYRSGRIFLSGAIPGGVLGSWLNQFISEDAFSLYLGLLMIVLSAMFFIKKKEPIVGKPVHSKGVDRTVIIDGEKFSYTYSLAAAVSIAFAVGILSGMFGIGGGSLIVPAMILLFGFPPHIATATSMFMILFLSLISSSTHIVLGHVPWQYVWLFIPGAWIGGTLGAKVNQLLKGKTVEWILRILLVVIGFRLILQGIG
ncbi:TSUP family transporter [Sediminibacillus dalangtanensis]|uniref:Probable membrane transporter protein n=1 Tax=Sediminibacillus dalangtanensis TaxID=2729421 RepID=A0ABX7VXH7_9BACI|nr:sulfite exporter TauE/SafE family protein [Sediminibacillus dalangtanensis]QTN00214.1 TSUP family transporter [Sediminibacillus dalangtanensis]